MIEGRGVIVLQPSILSLTHSGLTSINEGEQDRFASAVSEETDLTGKRLFDWEFDWESD